jgi:hypothetical protein
MIKQIGQYFKFRKRQAAPHDTTLTLEKEVDLVLPKANTDQSFWANVKKQFRKNRIAVWSLRFILVLVFIALLADFLANEKPIVAKYQGNVYFPVFRSI